MEGPQLERRAPERVAAGKSIKKEAENITERNINASQNTICSTSIPEHSRADVSLADRSHDGLPDIDTSANASNGFHDDCSAENSSSFPDSLDVNYLATKTNKIQQIVENATSPESKEIVTKILDQVQQLSVSEKLLLYLKLPTGTNISVDPLTQPINPLGSRFEIQQTITWIKTHLEENPDVSLPKQDVYDEYIGYCNNNAMKPLSTADFGKVMKQVFPRVRPRRLGTRGNSRYCYSGLRKRMKLDPPLLPDLGDLSRVGSHKPLRSGSGCLNSEDEGVHLGHRGSPERRGEYAEGNGDGEGGEMDGDMTSAASHLVREWAEKLLGPKFGSLPQLAHHLVKNQCVDGRSVAAFTVLSFDERSMRSQSSASGGMSLESKYHVSQILTKLNLGRADSVISASFR
ncbi:hypothetical protein J437_LFUL017095 [Ladona fulva]|uniref:RFX-type winged-helix domain-containing protein n=1 Tax=Ladona fulva TaxID=123851 RepID=A0A8K0P676_LADFU|nr:hypothetical protein J437_LFUL017095 [Ladona fulva]